MNGFHRYIWSRHHPGKAVIQCGLSGRFCETRVDISLATRLGELRGVNTGEENKPDCPDGSIFSNAAGQFEAIHTRHLHIQNSHVIGFATTRSSLEHF